MVAGMNNNRAVTLDKLDEACVSAEHLRYSVELPEVDQTFSWGTQ